MVEPAASDDAPTAPPDGDPALDPPHRGPRTRTWIAVALVGVAVVIGAATVALAVRDSARIHDGPGTATFTWVPVQQGNSSTPPTQPFTGDIDGLALQGSSTAVPDTSVLGGTGAGLPSGPIPAFRYRGTFAGSPFDLTLYYHFPTLPSAADSSAASAVAALQASAADLRITVSGTYGHSAVQATVTVPSAAGPATDHPATLVGTVGHWRVVGTVPFATGSSSKQTATAHFVVSG